MYAKSIDNSPMTAINRTLCLIENRNSRPRSAVVIPVGSNRDCQAPNRDHLPHHARSGVDGGREQRD